MLSHAVDCLLQISHFDGAHLSSQGKQRISNFRGGVKKAAKAFVVGFFGLTTLTPDQCREKVDFMLNNLTYIFPFVYEVCWSLSNPLNARARLSTRSAAECQAQYFF